MWRAIEPLMPTERAPDRHPIDGRRGIA